MFLSLYFMSFLLLHSQSKYCGIDQNSKDLCHMWHDRLDNGTCVAIVWITNAIRDIGWSFVTNTSDARLKYPGCTTSTTWMISSTRLTPRTRITRIFPRRYWYSLATVARHGFVAYFRWFHAAKISSSMCSGVIASVLAVLASGVSCWSYSGVSTDVIRVSKDTLLMKCNMKFNSNQ